LTVQLAVFPYVINLCLQPMYPSLDKALIGLKLAFTGASGANAGAEPFQMAPLSGKTRDKVLMLGQLYLQLTLMGSRPPGKDI
jgi:hypothetical protein